MIIRECRRAYRVCQLKWNCLSTRQKVLALGSAAFYGVGVVAGCYAVDRSLGLASINTKIVNTNAISSVVTSPICAFRCKGKPVQVFDLDTSEDLFPKSCKQLLAVEAVAFRYNSSYYIRHEGRRRNIIEQNILELQPDGKHCGLSSAGCRELNECVKKEFSYSGKCRKQVEVINKKHKIKIAKDLRLKLAKKAYQLGNSSSLYSRPVKRQARLIKV